MKYFLALTCLWSIHATAQEACPSVWIFKANLPCSHPSHGPDFSQPSQPKVIAEWSVDYRGGKDQYQACNEVRDGYNAVREPRLQARLNKPLPVGERKKKLVDVKYRYLCELVVPEYPSRVLPSPACGQEERFSYQVGGQPPMGSTCLSCEDFASRASEEMVSCLQNSIVNVIQARTIDLRDSDIQAVKAQVKNILKINKYSPISNLQTPEQLNLFIDFIER